MKFGGTALSRLRWADPPDKALSKLAFVQNRGKDEDYVNSVPHAEAIVDGGATSTVIGFQNYASICDYLGLEVVLAEKRKVISTVILLERKTIIPVLSQYWVVAQYHSR